MLYYYNYLLIYSSFFQPGITSLAHSFTPPPKATNPFTQLQRSVKLCVQTPSTLCCIQPRALGG